MMATPIDCQGDFLNYRQILRIPPSMHRTIFCMALSLIPLIGVGWTNLHPSGQEEKSYTPRLTANQITQCSLALCARFSDSVRRVREPQFHDDPLCDVTGRWRHHPMWTTLCEADGKRYYVQFNDLTGNMISLMPELGVMQHLASESRNPPIKTPDEAASIARIRLTEMRLVPPGARAALITAPVSVLQGRAWKIVWQVHPASPGPACEINMLLAHSGGVPLMVLDRSELAPYMEP